MQLNLSKTILSSVLLAGACIGKSTTNARLVASHRKLTNKKSYAVVANRKASSVSFIPEDGKPNETSDDVMTVTVPDSQPMYVNTGNNKIWIDDSKGNRIIVIDPENIDYPTFIPIESAKCNGLFHQWLNNEYLVVACTETNSVAVISVDNMKVEKYIELDNIGGCKPHDIVINPRNEIFVTTFGECQNQIIKIDADTGMELVRINVGTNVDPHVGLVPTDDSFLYSPQQKSPQENKYHGMDTVTGKVKIYRRRDLEEVQSLNVNNAHGICFAPNGSNMYVTNINGEPVGPTSRRLVEVMPKGMSRRNDAEFTGAVGCFGDTPAGGSHNCASTDNGKIFVTHSGDKAGEVSLFEINGNQLENKGFFITSEDANPFGIAIFKGEIDTSGPYV